jgi:hypothetical protein
MPPLQQLSLKWKSFNIEKYEGKNKKNPQKVTFGLLITTGIIC